MYEIEENIGTHYEYYDCLIYYALDAIVEKEDASYRPRHQIMPFCMRPSDIFRDRSLSNSSSFIFDTGTIMTFDELSRKGVNSDQLLAWSASIDCVERYQIYLNNPTVLLSQQRFYKCDLPWFGPQCQYKFITEANFSFKSVLVFTFGFHLLEKNDEINEFQEATCYRHLKCKRASHMCLDWREICDGKVDCLDGVQDEENCFPLEINDCDKNEYRCHNGMQCISREFLDDDVDSFDCIDRTDGPNIYKLLGSDYDLCNYIPTLLCEERSCPSTFFKNFVCGDGTCSDENGKCNTGRGNLIAASMVGKPLNKDSILYNCRMVMRCVTWQNCHRLCSTVYTCNKAIRLYCKQSLFAFPDYPILFGHVSFIFSNNQSVIKVLNLMETSLFSIVLLPDYLCYDEHLCHEVLPVTTILFRNRTCRRFDLKFGLISSYTWSNIIILIKKMFHQCLTIHDQKNRTHCRHPSLYRCANSLKCISKYRLNDGIQDCHKNDDEALTMVLYKSNATINDTTIKKTIPYHRVCDGYTDMEINDNTIETDETNCNWWPCNNIYTRCNSIWNCDNGMDEINCTYFSKCPLSTVPCISPKTFNLTCLAASQVSDGIIDCIGATDERYLCRQNHSTYRTPLYRCWNSSLCLDSVSKSILCDGKNDCPFFDDELICDRKYTHVCIEGGNRDNSYFIPFCRYIVSKDKLGFQLLDNLIIYPEQSLIQYQHTVSLRSQSSLINDNVLTTATESILKTIINRWKCNRGIHIFIRRNGSTKNNSCLCPPGYYGTLCDDQNQRVSLTLKVRVEFDWRTTFSFIITLIDEQQTIESYEQIQYLSIRDCDTKFIFNLLYSTRPKNESKNYSVRIDAYDKHTLKYRSSWIFPVLFSFLPVYKIVAQLTIPRSTLENCSLNCNYGRCILFSNKNIYACQCDPGWSGLQCNIFNKCQCSQDSLCVSSGLPSICICPSNRFGPRCYIPRNTCQPYTCTYHGHCIEIDDRIEINNFTCICNDGYSGELCQNMDTKIILIFYEILIPSSVLAHFITMYEASYTQVTIFKRILFDEDSITIYKSNEFHLLFIQFTSNYYLLIAQKKSIQPAIINIAINSSHRCFHINELINSSVINFEYLRQVKLYPLLCQQRLKLKCFYDETLMCLCNMDRFASCFDFNRNTTYDCHNNLLCQNGGQCFQDASTCPSKYMCICPECFYGTRCQLSTIGFSLSLDAILGYKVRPNIPLTQQSITIKINVLLILTLFILGLLNSILSIITFRSKTSQKVGCGIYLFSTSITSLIIIVVFLLKFFILIYTQIASNINRSFIKFNCISIDYLLRALLNINDWLYACVAIERVLTVYKGIYFDGNKSNYIAKWIVFIVIFGCFLSIIHDPLHRHLIDDTEEQRTWCTTSYSSVVKLYDSIIFLLHFFIPFIINLISSFIIIITLSRQKSTVRTNLLYKEHLHEQFRANKHLIISPCVLVLLALPRLVLSFLSGCMKSPRDPWRFLTGYFVSFIPSIVTFLIFVLPSKTYKEEFFDSIQRFKSKFSRNSHQT